MVAKLNRNAIVIAGMVCAMAAVYALGLYIERQGADEKKAYVDNLAGIILAQAESTLNDAMKAVKEVDSKGITTCTRTDQRILGFLSFHYPAIYEIGLFNKQGKMLCSNLGRIDKNIVEVKIANSDKQQVVLSMTLDRVQGASAMMLKWLRKDGTGIGVVIAPNALFNGFLQKNLHKFGHASIKMNNGMMINQEGALWSNHSRDTSVDIVSISRGSDKYPLTVSVEILAGALPGNSVALLLFVYIGGIVFTLLIGWMIATMSTCEKNMHSDIKAGIRRNEFIPYYQPIINSKTGAIAGCEVLMRWKKADGEIVPPGMFIPYMEMNGRIIDVTRTLMETVRDEMANFQRDNSGFFYSINLTAQHFTNNDVLDDVKSIFANSMISPSDLVFEITERQPLHDINAAGLIIDGLQSIGCKVALDDAGTGHGGLSYIQHLGVDKIKIDKMFVEAIDKGSLGAPILDALINMSRELGLSVIAEGVETERQLNYLCAHGAEYLQGFIFAPPMPREAFIHFYYAYHREIIGIVPEKPPEETPALLKTIADAAAA